MALEKTWLSWEKPVQILVDSGEVLNITPEGARLSEHFAQTSGFGGWYLNRRGGHFCTPYISRAERQYLRELKNIAAYPKRRECQLRHTHEHRNFACL